MPSPNRALPALALFVVACTGAPRRPPPAPVAPSGADATRSAPHRTLAELKDEFIAACIAKVPDAPAYCECGWEQMTRTFSLDELRSPVEDKAKLVELKERTEASCKRSLPEATIKAAFARTCVGDQPGRAPYCDCTWGELRAHFSAADLADGTVFTTDRFAATRRATAKTCGGRLPEDLARERFFGGCAKEDSLKPFCACAWNALRREGSASEIDGGHIDLEAAQPKVEKSCARHRPLRP
jgi:hypothetical protein